jgi:hypothetical protein
MTARELARAIETRAADAGVLDETIYAAGLRDGDPFLVEDVAFTRIKAAQCQGFRGIPMVFLDLHGTERHVWAEARAALGEE